MEFTATVSGLENLNLVLASLPKKLARRALVKAANAAKRVWVDAMTANAPVRSGAAFSLKGRGFKKVEFSKGGELRADIGAKITANPSKGSVSLRVGPRYSGKGSQDPGVYAMFVEFGSAHNAPPNPFVRKTFDETKDKALQVFADTLKDEILASMADA